MKVQTIPRFPSTELSISSVSYHFLILPCLSNHQTSTWFPSIHLFIHSLDSNLTNPQSALQKTLPLFPSLSIHPKLPLILSVVNTQSNPADCILSDGAKCSHLNTSEYVRLRYSEKSDDCLDWRSSLEKRPPYISHNCYYDSGWNRQLCLPPRLLSWLLSRLQDSWFQHIRIVW